MSMAWVAVGSAVLGAGASIYGANKQAKGAKDAAGMNMEMFRTLNAQQQPFIQSGYGAVGKLNTLLGIGRRPAANQSRYGGASQVPIKTNPMMAGGAGGQLSQSTALRNVLMLRASRGDTEAGRILRAMG